MDNTDDKRKIRGRNRWTEEEDAILYEEAVKQTSTGNVRDWHRISTKLPGRTNKDCRKRWINKVCGGLKKGLWDPEEDSRLQAAVEKHGLRWPLIANEVGFRSPDQCAKRWQYGLDPKLKHREWTMEEDKLLLALVQERGREWKAIQQHHYPTRSRIDLKNRHSILMRRMGGTSVEQDGDSSSSDSSVSDSDECGTPGPSSARCSSNNGVTDGSSSPHYRRNQQANPHRHSRLRSVTSASSKPPPYLAGGVHQHDWIISTTTHTNAPAVSDGISLDPTSSPVFTALGASVSGPAAALHGAAGAATAIPASADASLTTDFFDDVTASAAPASMSQVVWDDSLADMAFLTPTVSPTPASLLPHGAYASATVGLGGGAGGGATDTGKLPAVSSAAMEVDVSMNMDMVFDPELLNMSAESLLHPAGSSAAVAPQPGGTGSDFGDSSRGKQEGTDGPEKDVSKVVIAVDRCDKDTLDYLFNVTRPIKGRVKIEITM